MTPAPTIAACATGPWPGPRERPAIVIDDTRYDFAGLRADVMAYARGLRDLGIGSGARVGILMPNCIEWVHALLATAVVGGVSVPLNTRYELDELRYIADHSELTVVVTTSRSAGATDFESLVHRAYPEVWGGPPPDGYGRLPIRHVVVDRPPTAEAPFDEVVAAASTVRPADVATVLYTSGTTSRPKGCLMSHESLVRTGVARFEERRSEGGTLTVWTPCPFFHVGALVPLLGCLATGATFVTTRMFDAEETLALLEREEVTTALPLFSAFTDALMDSPRFESTDLSSLRDILTTGPRSGVERAQKAFAPARLVGGYGMTELCGVAASTPLHESEEDRLEWDGRPFEGIEMAVVDPDSGATLPAGAMGEIVARGYCTVTAYLKDPAATAKAFDEDGWFHTGDMGIAAPDGRVAFRGRFKDMLKVGGENVSALEVEEFIGRHPAVRRAEVVGVPDDRLNEVVAVFVELEPAASATEEDIVAYCRGRIARFKVPRQVSFVEPGAWPMSATKVDKVTLRRWAAGVPA